VSNFSVKLQLINWLLQVKSISQLKTLSLLLLWLILGIALRLTNLAAKPPWTDEFCTLVFSLGNSFHSVPLDRAIALDVLLQPLHPQPNAGVIDVLQHLLSESNHPPLYFLLAHWWMQLWQPDASGLASFWAARSLSALFGAASIPAVYGLAWLAFRSPTASHLAAAMMAVSPYGIFLAQEARHYTLAILWAIASISCLVIATRYIQQRTSVPIWLTASWVAVNFLGISTHYFFSLTLCAEAFVLIFLAWLQRRDKGTRGQGGQGRQGDKEKINAGSPPLFIPPSPLIRTPWEPQVPHPTISPWRQILLVGIGTLIGTLFWLPIFLHSNHGGELTAWIQSGNNSVIAWLSPIFQAIAAWITMISLLPVEATALPVVIVSGALMMLFFIWALPILRHGILTQLQQPATRLMTQLLAGVVLGAIALFFFFTYALGIDLTRGARYNFVYFPAVMVLLGASLAVTWHTPASNLLVKKQKFFLSSGKASVALICLMGLLSAITVVCNLGYQKYYRPDLLAQLIQNFSQVPILVATTQKTHVQIGEMMGIAREFKLNSSTNAPLFLLAHQDQNPNTSTATLQKTLTDLSKPLDLWLVNFYAPVKFNNCVAAPLSSPPVDGYNYQLFHCHASSKIRLWGKKQ
jgi:uncharacterized membrane protein